MKKLCLTLALFFCVGIIHAQETDEILWNSGNYLVKSSHQILTGIGIQMASSFVVYYGAQHPVDKGHWINEYTSSKYWVADIKLNPIIYVGLAGGVVGFVFEIVGLSNIGKAGLILNGQQLGVSIPIK